MSVLSVRVEEDIKRSFDSFCNDVGLNPSVAINMFIKATLKQRKIPFEISSGIESLTDEWLPYQESEMEEDIRLYDEAKANDDGYRISAKELRLQFGI